MAKRGSFNVLDFEPLFDVSLPGSGRGRGPGARRDRFTTKNAVLRRIARNVRGDQQVLVKVTSKGYSHGQARNHVAYITRHGRLTAEDENGFEIVGSSAVGEKLKGWRLSAVPIPIGPRPSEQADNPKSGKSQRELRQTIHMVFGMPAGTDPQLVLEATRRFARKEFAAHQYLMVLHEPSSDPKPGAPEHPHVHVAVRALSEHGRRLQVDRDDLLYFREAFAEHLRELGVAANASSRFERGARRGVSRSTLARRERQAAGAASRDLNLPDMTLPSVNLSRLMAMVRDDYLVVVNRLSRSQREEDLKFAEALKGWIDQLPILRTAIKDVEARVNVLRDALAKRRGDDVSRSDDQERSR